jgi:hypothetical protein
MGEKERGNAEALNLERAIRGTREERSYGTT